MPQVTKVRCWQRRTARPLPYLRPYTAVIDADLQHDETLLPKMLTRLRNVDIVIGGRYTAAGSVGGGTRSGRP